MPYFVISNFANGRDLRRSSETAPSGTLRILRNAFVNEGGQIEKRRAWVKQADVTAYAQHPLNKGRVVGPVRCPNCENTVFFRHRSPMLPDAPFEAGPSGDSARLRVTDPNSGAILRQFWVQRSAIDMPGAAALLRAHVSSEFSSNAYVVESFLDPATRQMRFQHVYVPHTNSEPSSEDHVTDNEGRPAQMVLASKSHVASGNTLFASALGDPTAMTGTGAGSTDLTNQGLPIGQAVALAEYFGQLVIFGRRGVMFWSVDPDFDQNQYLRAMEAAIFAARTATAYSGGDVLFLTRGGVRSLQARDSSNEARVSDVGSPIDLEIRRLLDLDPDDTEPLFGALTGAVNNQPYYNTATGIIHHDTGQFWLALRDQVHVLTRYPSARVLAWATFDLPEIDLASEEGPNGAIKGRWVADWCEMDQTVILRNFADEVYVYGGDTGAEYDDALVEVTTPFMDMGRPGSNKHFRGLDLVCDGEWFVEFATIDPGDERFIQWQPIGQMTGSTRAKAKVAFQAQGVQIAFRLTCKQQGRARLSEILVHYNEASQK
jgi:hypothetical protein